MEMLFILLSFNAIYALVPLVVIAILILAAAGLTRGKDVFEIFGFGTLFGFAQQQGGGTAGKGLTKQKVNLQAVKLLGWTGPAMVTAQTMKKGVNKAKVDRLAKKDAEAELIANNPAVKAVMSQSKPGQIHPHLYAQLTPEEQAFHQELQGRMATASAKLSAVRQKPKTIVKTSLGETEVKPPVTVLKPGEVTNKQYEKLQVNYMKARSDYYKNVVELMKKHAGTPTSGPNSNQPSWLTGAPSSDLNLNMREVKSMSEIIKSAQPTILNQAWRNQQLKAKERHISKHDVLAAAIFVPLTVSAVLLLPPVGVLALGGVGFAAAIGSNLKTRNAMNKAKKKQEGGVKIWEGYAELKSPNGRFAGFVKVKISEGGGRTTPQIASTISKRGAGGASNQVGTGGSTSGGSSYVIAKIRTQLSPAFRKAPEGTVTEVKLPVADHTLVVPTGGGVLLPDGRFAEFSEYKPSEGANLSDVFNKLHQTVFNDPWRHNKINQLQQKASETVLNRPWWERQARYQFRNVEFPDTKNPSAWFREQARQVREGVGLNDETLARIKTHLKVRRAVNEVRPGSASKA